MTRTRQAWIWIWTAATAFAAIPVSAQSPSTPAVFTLDAALAEALEHSPVLQPHDDAVTIAGIRRNLAAADFGVKVTPSIAAMTDPVDGDMRSAGVTVTKKLSSGGQLFVNAQTYTFGDAASGVRSGQYSVGISQPLLRGFRRTATADLVNADRARVTAARDLASARGGLMVDVVRRYVAVVKAQRVVAAADEAARHAAALEQASEARTSAGTATELDVLGAQLERSRLTGAVLEARSTLAAAEDDLAVLVGRPVGAPLAIDSSLDATAFAARLKPVPETLDDLVTQALADRMDVTEARDKIDDAARAADVARWNLAPPISLDLSYTQRGLNAATPTLDLTTGGWRVGLSTTYSIDRAAGAAAAGTARVEEGGAERAAHDAEEKAAVDVRRTYRAWQAAMASVDLDRGAVGLSEREVALAELRLDRGLSDTLDVIAAEDGLLQARTALIGAEWDGAVLALDLRRAVGALDGGDWPW